MVVWCVNLQQICADKDVIAARALWLCLGAVWSALHVEGGEIPLWLRRMQLMANYWLTLEGCTSKHPTKTVLEPCWEGVRQEKISFGRRGN